MKVEVCLAALLLTTAMVGGSHAVGAYKDANSQKNDARTQEIAKFAAKKISEEEGKQLDFVKLSSVSTQVVAGKNYKLVLDLATPEQKVQAYDAVVYEPLGGQGLQLTEHKALDRAHAELASEESSESRSGALLGGYKEADANAPEAQEAAKFATEQISGQSNSLLPLQLKKVLQVKQKVANGKVWDLKLELGSGNQPAKIYEVEVSQSLQNEFKLQHVSST